MQRLPRHTSKHLTAYSVLAELIQCTAYPIIVFRKELFTPQNDLAHSRTQGFRVMECGNGESSLTPVSISESYGQTLFEYLGFQSRAPIMSSISTMKAVHYEKPFQVGVREIPVPSIKYSDHDIIQVTIAGMLPTVNDEV